MSTRIIRRIAGLALALGIGVLWTPTPANANMRMELFDNATVLALSSRTLETPGPSLQWIDRH